MSIVLTIIFTLLSAFYDATLFLSFKYFTNHFYRFIFRAIVIFAISYIFTVNKNCTICTFLLFVLNSSIFYLLFDYSLNYFWGQPLLRIGKTAIIDKIWSLFGSPIYQLLFKIIFVIFMLFLFKKCSKSEKKFDNMRNKSYLYAVNKNN
jgi:hypothetical protein